jgi:hypothetical protein
MRSDGLYALADDSIGPDLDHLALIAAAGSPRRMLQVISALFDLHATSAHRSRLIQRQDWVQLCAAWRDHDYPLPLPNTRGDS